MISINKPDFLLEIWQPLLASHSHFTHWVGFGRKSAGCFMAQMEITAQSWKKVLFFQCIQQMMKEEC